MLYQRRTDVSAAVTNPIFSANTFYLPFTPMQQTSARLQFACFVVTNQSQDEADASNGQARLLGDCVLELGPIMPSINDQYGVGVRQHLAFARRRDEKDITVGRFTCIIKLVVRILYTKLYQLG